LLVLAATGSLPAAEPAGPAKTIHLQPRYVRLYTNPGVELAAANYQYKTLDWDVPANEIALVCLDCWNWHFSCDTFEQMEKAVHEAIEPLLAAWRARGMLVIHAPAGPVAQRHPNWTRLTEGKKPQVMWPDSPNWPPAEFRQKTGVYARYARPKEPQDVERSTHAQKKRDFHPLIRPVGTEPVVLDGEELHRLCAQRKILHLVYVGFNTNACIMLRDYGLPAMNRRGYTTILVRDGTFGMETAQTSKDSSCTRGAIADLEQFGSYTLSSHEIIGALAASGKRASTGDALGDLAGTFHLLSGNGGQLRSNKCLDCQSSTGQTAGADGPNSTAQTTINAVKAGGLQAALDALPKQGGTIFLPAGRHVFTRPVVKRLTEGQHLFLVGEGRATVLVNENHQGQELLHLVGAVGQWWPDLKITIRDLTFVGNHQSGDALVIEYPNDTMIDGCFFQGHGGKAIYFKVHGTNVTCRDCWIRDCKRGVYAENLHHLTLHGNQTRSLKEGQVQVEHVYLDRNCREVRIVNNHLAYGHNEAIILDGTAQHVIVGNTIEGFRTGILARHDKERDCRDITIGSNYIHGGCAMRLTGRCNGFVVSNNIITDASDGAVVVEQSENTGGHSISGNVMRKSVYKGQGGVILGDSQGCSVVGNLFEEVLTTPAIAAGPGGGQHLISANNVTRSQDKPILVKDAPGCQVSGNLVNGKP
jgi:nicotinamidase-related amidase